MTQDDTQPKFKSPSTDNVQSGVGIYTGKEAGSSSGMVRPADIMIPRKFTEQGGKLFSGIDGTQRTKAKLTIANKSVTVDRSVVVKGEMDIRRSERYTETGGRTFYRPVRIYGPLTPEPDNGGEGSIVWVAPIEYARLPLPAGLEDGTFNSILGDYDGSPSYGQVWQHVGSGMYFAYFDAYSTLHDYFGFGSYVDIRNPGTFFAAKYIGENGIVYEHFLYTPGSHSYFPVDWPADAVAALSELVAAGVSELPAGVTATFAVEPSVAYRGAECTLSVGASAPVGSYVQKLIYKVNENPATPEDPLLYSVFSATYPAGGVTSHSGGLDIIDDCLPPSYVDSSYPYWIP